MRLALFQSNLCAGWSSMWAPRPTRAPPSGPWAAERTTKSESGQRSVRHQKELGQQSPSYVSTSVCVCVDLRGRHPGVHLRQDLSRRIRVGRLLLVPPINSSHSYSIHNLAASMLSVRRSAPTTSDREESGPSTFLETRYTSWRQKKWMDSCVRRLRNSGTCFFRRTLATSPA